MLRSATSPEVATPQPTNGYMTYAQFLEMDCPNPHLEWVNGKVIEMAPISDEHSDLQVFLAALLRNYVDALDLGKIRTEPFQMKTGPDLPGRAPDVLFVAKKNLRRLKRTYLEGPADMVVEVISPSTQSVDRGDKYYEYESGGVREYWLLDPIRKKAEFYIRGRDGSFRAAELDDNIFRSSVLKGLWIDTSWLWRRPSTIEILKKWKIV